MQIKHGLISCDSHAQLHKDAWTSRMSKAKFGDEIPQLRETTDKAHMAIAIDKPVRALVRARQGGGRTWRGELSDGDERPDAQDTSRSAGRKCRVMSTTRASASRRLDQDGVDGEVLFPNDPVQSGTFFQGDAEFELACVQAYNDALAEWREVSDRYVPLAIIPYLSGIEVSGGRKPSAPCRRAIAASSCWRAEHDARRASSISTTRTGIRCGPPARISMCPSTGMPAPACA